MRKIEKDAEKANKGADITSEITEALLKELAKNVGGIVAAKLKAAKSPAARADLLFALSNHEWKVYKKQFETIDNFLTKLEQWFVQEFSDDQRGVTGKYGRVEVKSKEIATVADWAKFYKYIAKNGEFDLLNKAVNQKAVQERWEQKKQVPGVGKFTKKVVSLTGVKK